LSESRTVLLVDDEEGILIAYLRCLGADLMHPGARELRGLIPCQGEFEGFLLLAARSGVEAVEAVERELAEGRRVACGFFDLRMPGIDGVETMRRLRLLDPDMLCTVVTANLGESLPDLAGIFGAGHADEWDYLAKPFSRGEIIQKCRQMVSSWNRRRREEAQVQEIRQLHDEASRSNAVLEERVGARTADLAAANDEMRRKNTELNDVLAELSRTQERLVSSEKMASIAQLAAGVGARVDGPVEFVEAEMARVAAGMTRVGRYLAQSDATLVPWPDARQALFTLRRELRVDGVLISAPESIEQIREVLGRVRDVGASLRAFAQACSQPQSQHDVVATVRAALDAVSQRLDGIRVLEALSGPVAVRCNVAALQQVFEALLANAADAIAVQGGSGEIRVSACLEGDVAVVEVADDGCGMHEDELPRIFEPFYTTKNDGSAGLSLAVAYGVVKRHGGELSASSTPGQGTRMRVRLPVACSPD
jgi:two-component system NtrC family sensor kinase